MLVLAPNFFSSSTSSPFPTMISSMSSSSPIFKKRVSRLCSFQGLFNSVLAFFQFIYDINPTSRIHLSPSLKWIICSNAALKNLCLNAKPGPARRHVDQTDSITPRSVKHRRQVNPVASVKPNRLSSWEAGQCNSVFDSPKMAESTVHPLKTPSNSRHSPLDMPEVSCVTCSPFTIRRMQSSAVADSDAPPMR